MKVPTKPKQKYWKTIGFYLLIILAASFLIYGFTQPKDKGEIKPMSELLRNIEEGKVQEVQVDGDNITAKLKNNSEIHSIKEEGESFVSTL